MRQWKRVCGCVRRFCELYENRSLQSIIFVLPCRHISLCLPRLGLKKSFGEMTLVFAGQEYLFYGIITKSVQNLCKPWQMTTHQVQQRSIGTTYYSLDNCYSFRLVLSKYIAILHYVYVVGHRMVHLFALALHGQLNNHLKYVSEWVTVSVSFSLTGWRFKVGQVI